MTLSRVEITTWHCMGPG